MSGNNQIEDLKSKKATILLSEIGALIHDIGKLSNNFIESHLKEEMDSENKWIYHTAQVDFDIEKGSNKISKFAKKFKNLLLNTNINLNSETSNLFDECIYGHHQKKLGQTEKYDKPSNWTFCYPSESDLNNSLHKIINSADNFDSGEDRGNARESQKDETYKSNAFGNESNLDCNFEEERRSVYKEVISFLNDDIEQIIKKSPITLKKKLKTSFDKTLGMTARAANDVTLWEHSYMTASIAKVLINESILQEELPIINSIEDIDKKEPFKILSIGWDYFDFLSQSQKISDIIGRENSLEKIKMELRRKIECDIPLGNKIYDDENGIHFLIPVSFDNEKIINNKIFDVFTEETRDIILPTINYTKRGNSINQLISYAIEKLSDAIKNNKRKINDIPQWVNQESKKQKDSNEDTVKNICNLCGKGLYNRKYELKLCDRCKDIRNKDIGKGRKRSLSTLEGGNLARNTSKSNEKKQTKFVDEVAWNPGTKKYDRISLFIFDFDIKKFLNGNYINSIYLRNPFENKDKILSLGEYLIFEKIKESGVPGIITKLTENSNNKEALTGISKNIGNKANWKYYLKLYFKKIEIKFNMDISYKNNLYNFLEKNDYDLDKVRETLSELEGICLDDEYINSDEANKIVNELYSGKPILEKARRFYSDIGKPDNKENFYKKYIQKKSSPSRIMRVWKTTYEFLNDFEGNVLKNNKKNINRIYFKVNNDIVKNWGNEGVLELDIKEEQDGNIEYKDVECILNDNKNQIEIIDPKVNSELDSQGEICVSIKRKGDNSQIRLGEKKIQETEREINPYRILSQSPKQFMFLAPANKTEAIMNKIKDRYEQQLGKVYGKLPLNIGAVFGKRKTPMFSMIDAARRFRQNHDEIEDTKEFKVIQSEKNTEEGKYNLKFKRNNKEDRDEFKYEINIPYKLGNGEPDLYHPYIRVNFNNDEKREKVIDVETRDNNISQIHIADIQKDDIIELDIANFDFEYLDTNRRRFDISLNEKNNRDHEILGEEEPRPYLFEDWQRFEKMKEIFREIGKWTPIRDIESIAAEKREKWSDEKNKLDEQKEIYKSFIESLLLNKLPKSVIKDHKRFLKHSILNGLYFDAVELFNKVLKIDLGGNSDE